MWVLLLIIYCHKIDVIIGLHPLSAPVREGETFSVCAELMSGSLGRSITIALEAINNSAISMHIIYTYYLIQPNNFIIFIINVEGVDFIGPEPSLLTFTSGLSMGDVQCANVTILDDTTLSGQRNLSIGLRNHDENDSGVRIDISIPSIDIMIDVDTDDGK